MKFVVLIITFSVLSFSTYAQSGNGNKNIHTTRLESMMTQSGLIIKKDVVNIGEVNGILIKKIIVTAIEQQKSVVGAKLEFAFRSSQVTGLVVTYIDDSEALGIMNAIYLITDSLSKSTPSTSVEYYYTTVSLFQVGTKYSPENMRWVHYFCMNIDEPNMIIYASNEELKSFAVLLNQLRYD